MATLGIFRFLLHHYFYFSSSVFHHSLTPTTDHSSLNPFPLSPFSFPYPLFYTITTLNQTTHQKTLSPHTSLSSISRSNVLCFLCNLGVLMKFTLQFLQF
ncbi:hypothetical protein VNO80_20829 [Phaseolus coccineus]|uniref:Uncharacterized protein n=1 Tax=Phaseolus coccineus TaxID=3886 RepID=A0AAN9M6T9_PHACN